ncbi:MAG: hypothetical protein CMA12_06775 [Euryarchaeota archaeon]|nr:hypothetical protein [Euryarchaeota archaeon]OUW22146.1 MAG: hypothetical protein CBD33_03735 [Euryarchaeota archaeon TMED173]
MVPNELVETSLSILRENEWLASGMRIFAIDDNHRMIPLDPGAPEKLPDPLHEIETSLHEGAIDMRVDSDWWHHLSSLIENEEIERFREQWPSSHEFISDMMVVRIEAEIEHYSSKIAIAKLEAHPHIRLLLRDEGVKGELRLRQLTPLAARVGNEIVIQDIPEQMLRTHVTVKESGQTISCDPTRAFFSTKLQTERLETLSLARELREILDRPLRVCDPFCGVGPALATLLGEPDLISEALASDLNPDAIEILLENLSRWDGREYPTIPDNISYIYEDRIVGIADASKLSSMHEFTGIWDLLIVNLPHRTIEILPSLEPLIDRTSPSLVRGRAIVSENEIDQASQEIANALPPILEGSEPPFLKIKRDYSSILRLCSFEAWIAPE